MVDVVAGTVATNYDTATSHTITVRETLVGALNSPRDTVLTINVTEAGAAPGPFTLAWTSAASELTNLSFSITPAPLVGDVVTLSLDGNSDMSSPFDTSDPNTVDSGEAGSGSLTFTGIATPLTAGLTYARVNVNRGGLATDSSIASITLTAGDTTGPVLSLPTGVQTGSTTATMTVTTDEANGTLYASASTSTPGSAQIKAGLNSGGAPSSYAFNQPVTTTGVQTKNATGLTPSTPYRMHYYQEDAAANPSNVASATSFTTDAAGGGWSPLDLGAKLLVFYDPNVPASITGSPISQLADLSPNADHLGQVFSGLRPTLDANGFGTGKEGILFDGVDDSIITAGGAITHPGTAKLTIAGVAKINQAAAHAAASLACYNGGTSLYYDASSALFYRSGANTLTLYKGGTGPSATVTDNTRFRYIAQCNGTAGRLLFNGAVTSNTALAGTAFPATGTVCLGSTASNGDGLPGSQVWGSHSGPLIICNDVLTTPEETSLDAWLAAWNT